MPRGYWCIGLAALLAAAPLTAQQTGDAGSGQGSAQQSSKMAKDAPPPRVPAIDRIADELAETRKDQSDPYGDERNQREKRDIVAQERSAHWAQANFWAIVLQTLLAAGALAAILFDIGQSRKSSETQTRAYVTLGKTDLLRKSTDSGTKKWFIDIDMENKGQTPAYVRHFSVSTGWRRKGIAEEIIDEISFSSRDIQVVIASGKQFGIWVEIEAEFHPEALHSGDTLILYGKIEYLDIFEIKRVTDFKLYADSGSWARGAGVVHIHTSMTGNTCT